MVSATSRDADLGRRRRGAIAGAISGALATILPMMLFFPLGRLFDPSMGGTPRGSLATEVVLGFMGGVMISPVGGGFGALVGRRLGLRSLRASQLFLLMLLPVVVGVGTFVAINGGLIDERGSSDSLQLVLTLGLLAWLVGIVCYSAVRPFLVGRPSLAKVGIAT